MVVQQKQRQGKPRTKDLTPEDLKELGFIVRFSHWRLTKDAVNNLTNRLIDQESLLKSRVELDKCIKELDEDQKRNYILSTGGKTVCHILWAETGDVLAIGKSICHPTADTYNKQRGRIKSFGKAIKDLKRKFRIDGSAGWSEFYEKILNELNAHHIRPKLNPPSHMYSVAKIKKIIEDIQREAEENGSSIDDIQTSCFIEDLLSQLED